MNTILPNVRIADRDMEFIFCEIKARLYQNKILRYLARSNNPQVEEIVEYLKQNRISVFPYKYKQKYRIKNVCVQKDFTNGQLFIEYKGMKLYMRRGYKSKLRAARYFNNIQIEQDKCSPHCYVSDVFYPEKDSVILDIGGAEGYFSIPYIQYVKKIFIFECNPEWIEALNRTYENYRDKVVIIDKFVSDHSDDNHITLDDFMEKYQLLEENIFIKVDAEGSEPAILDGGKQKLLQSGQKIKISVCTYHCMEHEELFRKIFKDWKIEASDGYMLYYYDYNFKEPYVRRGLLRIENTPLLEKRFYVPGGDGSEM